MNPVLEWGLGTAEGAVRSSLGRSLSLLGPFSGPLSVVDALLCRGLDMVEYNVPIITLPPELVSNLLVFLISVVMCSGKGMGSGWQLTQNS